MNPVGTRCFGTRKSRVPAALVAMRTAFITGIAGQDGAYLARLLRDHGYTVYGTVRPDMVSYPSTLAALGLEEEVELLPLDFCDEKALRRTMERAAPDEIYHLASQSSIGRSFNEPVLTCEVNALFTARLLEATRQIAPQARFLFASSCDIFGHVSEFPQTEATPVSPRSPYGSAKAYGHFLSLTYRNAYNLHTSCAIMYNHESPLRPPSFVTRKITLGVARIKEGLQDELVLGNLDVKRDWGFAGDYVEALHLMLQQEKGDDYILATGQMRSLRQFVDLAFSSVGLHAEDYVRIDPALLRLVDESALVGNPCKAEQRLGWRSKIKFEELVPFLVEADLEYVQRGLALEARR